MNKKTIVSIIVILVLIVGVTLYGQFVGFGRPAADQTAAVVNSQDLIDPMIITALHQFENGKHIVAGQIDLPTPCHILSAESVISESMPQQVMINFTSSVAGDEVCAQVITPARYKVEFEAAQDAQIEATWNGAPAQLNLVPVAAGEDLENFDVFIKG